MRTDHASLRWLQSFHEPEGQVARWLECLSEYDFEVVHRPGTKHINADALPSVSAIISAGLYDATGYLAAMLDSG